MSIRTTVAVVLSLLLTGAVLGQVPPEPEGTLPEKMDGGAPSYIRPETPEQRKTRLGTAEDPGHNPDPAKEYWRFGYRAMIEKYDRQWARFDRQEGYVRPFGFANFAYEIYQQNEKYVWVWIPLSAPASAQPPTNRPAGDAPAEKVTPYTAKHIEYFGKIRHEYESLTPGPSSKTVRFEESSQGLPQTGSWRNSGALADMNGDGHLDILAPPQRGMSNLPAIYLGDGKGNWTTWNTVWPYEFDYGSVVAADFNGDKHMDVGAGIHLRGVRVFVGDGKGNFTEASKGLPSDFPSRRVVASDVDADRDIDLLAIYEGPSGGPSMNGARVVAFLNQNRASEWKPVGAIDAADLSGGDALAVGRFNDDKYPDFITSSNYYQSTDLLYRSGGPAKWSKIASDGFLIPFMAIHTAVATGKLSSTKYDDALVAYMRNWPKELDSSLVEKPELDLAIGIDRISFAGGEVKRTPVIRFAADASIGGIAVADFDGDRNQDIVFVRHTPRELVVLLGDGKGKFSRAMVEGLKAEKNPTYDVRVGDVNADSRPDIMMMYESDADSRFGRQNGSIHVFLNRGASAPSAAKNASH